MVHVSIRTAILCIVEYVITHVATMKPAKTACAHNKFAPRNQSILVRFKPLFNLILNRYTSRLLKLILAAQLAIALAIGLVAIIYAQPVKSPKEHGQKADKKYVPPLWIQNMANQRKFEPCRSAPERMVCIPGGIYVRGSEQYAQDNKEYRRAESPRNYVILDTYYVDQYEVTNAQYRACMDAGYCRKPAIWVSKGSAFWKRFRTPDRPFVRATWFMSRDYCRWMGKRLLSEAEWEAAARGPSGDTYPWGNDPPDCTKANYRAHPPHTSYPRPSSIMRFCPPPDSPSREMLRASQDQTWNVGITPPFRGIYDMAGNGYEWVNDAYDPHAYAGCNQPNSPHCNYINPHGPCKWDQDRCSVLRSVVWEWRRVCVEPPKHPKKRWQKCTQWQWKRISVHLPKPRRFYYSKHILKGGSWWWYSDHLRGASRRPENPNSGTHRLSIRCGSSKPEIKTLPPKKHRSKK